ncbi:unnamed protein product [Arctia plantaginis]|uniref:Uncharacterized protein n=1 Tax=Arctia plantaginis TaxID=874455 RepID=A0A8S1AQK9_ARCPL|nr:unnamed protein product [Arctia plantaginis]
MILPGRVDFKQAISQQTKPSKTKERSTLKSTHFSRRIPSNICAKEYPCLVYIRRQIELDKIHSFKVVVLRWSGAYCDTEPVSTVS